MPIMNNFRRHPIDRVNPRHVPPSRHAIFIRGLPGSTNVDTVKSHFTAETNSKCSVEFFSTSEDNNRFSVAIRFKNNEIARSMMDKYNGKTLLGSPVEISWFKDLKKARSRVYEDQRNHRFRGNFPRGFRGGPFRGASDRRGRHFSPQGYAARRHIDRSRSGDDGPRDPPRRIVPSSPSGSSRFSSDSGSRSKSRSPKRHRQDFDNASHRREAPENSIVSRRIREQSHRSNSHSTSNSSSRSSSNNSGLNARLSSTRKNDKFSGHVNDFAQKASVSPANVNSSTNIGQFGGRQGSVSGQGTVSFSPVHTVDNGLTSGLIQLKTRPTSSSRNRNPMIISKERPTSSHLSGSRASSASSRSSSSSVRAAQRRRRHVSPRLSPSNESLKLSLLSPTKSSNIDLNIGKKAHQPSETHADRWRPITYIGDEEPSMPSSNLLGRQPRQKTSSSLYDNDEMEVVEESDPSPQNQPPIQQSLFPRNVTSNNQNLVDNNHPRTPTSSPRKLSTSTRGQRQPISPERRRWSGFSPRKMALDDDINKSPPRDQISIENTAKEIVKDKQTIIQEKKSSIEEEYKRDCETFATVVRTLISKDNDLEQRLLPLLKEILHERGQRCIEELRASIAEQQGGTE